MIKFDKLFLVKDNEYGTHVTYTNGYPDYIFLDYFTDRDSLDKILKELQDWIEIEKLKIEKKKTLK